jgi:hypothetical protein
LETNPHAAARPCSAPAPAQDEDAALAAALAASMEDAQPAPSARAAPPLRAAPAAAPPAARGKAGPAPSAVVLPDGTAVTRRIIDSDNSCLFNAVGYVMEGTRTKAAELRRVIARAVAADPGAPRGRAAPRMRSRPAAAPALSGAHRPRWPDTLSKPHAPPLDAVTYNDGFLGQENEAYQRWITQPDKWGGAIEVRAATLLWLWAAPLPRGRSSPAPPPASLPRARPRPARAADQQPPPPPRDP